MLKWRNHPESVSRFVWYYKTDQDTRQRSRQTLNIVWGLSSTTFALQEVMTIDFGAHWNKPFWMPYPWVSYLLWNATLSLNIYTLLVRCFANVFVDIVNNSFARLLRSRFSAISKWRWNFRFNSKRQLWREWIRWSKGICCRKGKNVLVIG